jgi:uncharacterized protein (TIGR03435 family)
MGAVCTPGARRLLSRLTALSALVPVFAVGPGMASLSGQTPNAAVRRFEVASVRINTSNDRPRLRVNAVAATGRVTLTGLTVQEVIQEAYGLQAFELVSNGSPVLKQRIDVIAKAETPVTIGEMQRMLQPLLEERFRLAVHREMRDMDALLLVRANDARLGPKIMPSTAQCDGLGSTIAFARETREPQSTTHRCGVLPVDGPGRILANGIDLRGLAALLAPSQGRPVVDMTRLARRYDVDVTYTPEPFSAAALARRGATAPPGVDPNGPTLATALLDQLGLKLAPRRTSVPVVVIDRIEALIPD